MNTVVGTEPRIRDVHLTEDEIIASLVDGRVISVPLAWSWRLSEATPAQRTNFRIIGSGQGVHWPDVNEDLSVEGMLSGTPARRPKSAAVRAHRVPVKEPPNKRMQPTREGRRTLLGRRATRG